MSNKPQRATELGVIYTLNEYVLIQQSELDCVEEELSFTIEAYIYFVCRRPRMFVDPEYFVIEGDNCFSLAFGFQRANNRVTEFNILVTHDLCRSDLVLNSPFPNNYFSIESADGKTLFQGKVASFLDEIYKGNQDAQLAGLEVLYIGQGQRENAVHRLKKHSTVQKITAQTLANQPDYELYLLLTTFKEKNLIGVSGMVELTPEEEERDLNRFMSLMQNGGKAFDKIQQVNLIEAALINYFKTVPYNQKFVKHFPLPTHTSYSEYYAADVNSILVELDTRQVGYQLFSGAVAQHDRHAAEFYFPKGTERYRLFEA